MSENKLLLQNVTLVDGTGNGALPPRDILFEGKRIAAIRPAGTETFGEDVRRADYTGMTVIPGIIDCHVHICMEPVGDPVASMRDRREAELTIRGLGNMKKLLENGITYFRSMGDPNYIDIDLSRARQAGLIQGPHFIPAGKLICMTGGHGWQMGREADGPDEVRKAVREQLKAGAGHIKLMATGGVMTPNVKSTSTQLGQAELTAGVEEAHNAGVKTATHAQGNQGIRNAVLAGIDSVEHGFHLDEEILAWMKDQGTVYVPTLCAPYFILEGAAHVPPFILEKTRLAAEAHKASFRLALQSGVKIALGTDAGTPFNLFGSARKEILLMTQEGMSPEQAIVAASKNAAELLGISQEYGTLEEGKMADLLVLKRNPLEDPAVIMEDLIVYKDGALVG